MDTLRLALLSLIVCLAAHAECPSEIVTLNESEFSIPELNRRAREVLRRVPDGSFLVVDFRTSKHPVEIGSSADGFERWVEDRRKYLRGYRRAELLVTAVGAVLRVRLEAGETKTSVLKGQNPLSFTVDGRAFDVLSLWPPWKAYVVGPIGNMEENRQVAEAVEARFPCKFEWVYLRRNPWFVTSLSKLFPFLPDARTPNYADWARQVQVQCRATPAGYGCRQATGAELEPRETVPQVTLEVAPPAAIEEPPQVR